MHRIPAISLGLACLLTPLGGSALAQAELDASPAPTVVENGPAAVPPATDIDASASIDFQVPRWRKISPGTGPAAREDHTWTVDAEGRFAYLFGGRDGDRTFADLWRYDLARDTWKRIRPRGRGPAARFGHSAAWVEGRGLALFAGQAGQDFFDDLWVYDPDPKRWRELPAKGQAPKRRYGSCMVVGRDGRLMITHGFTSAGRFDDTRAYDLESERWAVLTPDGRKPGERCLHDCFTSAAGDLVLYGGQDDGHFALGDLWLMDRGRRWARLADPEARPRRLFGVTEAGRFAYVFGGASEDDVMLADTWRVDRETLEFERARVQGDHPAARYAGTLITDMHRGRVLLFGGQAASGARSDVWELIESASVDEGAVQPVAPSVEPVPTGHAADATDP